MDYQKKQPQKNLIITLLIIIPLFLTTTTPADAQEPVTPRQNTHEIGTDAMPFIHGLNIFNSGPFFTPNSDLYNLGYRNPYSLIYRKHFNKYSARMGVGGSVYFDAITVNDTTEILRNSTSFKIRAGIEGKTELGKRWQSFYGMDFFYRMDRDHSDNMFSNAGQVIGADLKIINFGISPMLGFRFRINSRISLSTETNIELFYFQSSLKRLHVPDSTLNFETTSRGIRTYINLPTNLYFSFGF